MKAKLTDRLVRSLKPPKGLTKTGKPKKDELHTDAELRGFMLRVTMNGTKTWLVQRKDDAGKTRRVALGDWPTLSAEQARAEAQRVLAAMVTGSVADVAASKNKRGKPDEAQSDRIADLIELYEELRLSEYKSDHSRNIASKGIRAMLEPHMDKRLVELTTADIAASADAWRVQKKNVTANRRVEQTRAFYNWCVSRGVEAQAVKFPKSKEKSRDRVLTVTELAAVLRCLDKMPHLDFPDAMKLLVLTGARRTEISELHTREVDIGARLIRLPGSRTKNGSSVVIPLSDAAAELLERRMRHVRNGFLFGRWSGGEKAFSGFSKLKKELDKLLEEELPDMSHWTTHDLRRTVATLMVSQTDADPLVVESEVLHHATALSSIARVYQKARRTDKAAEALENWGRFVVGLTADNVVRLTDSGLTA